MSRFISEQFSLSTAEDALNYFSGQSCPAPERPAAVLPAGTYRVVDGTLCRVLPGLPPELEQLRTGAKGEAKR